MKTAIVHFAGLGTDVNGDLCGMRAFWEGLAEALGATFHVIAWDDPRAHKKFKAVCNETDVVHTSGHSHGATELYRALEVVEPANVITSAFLDLCPPWNPHAWMGPDWPPPPSGGASVCFYQHNDLPLCGVKIALEPANVIDVGKWGLHHAGANGLCADSRVHNRIKLEVHQAHLVHLRAFYQRAGGGGGGGATGEGGGEGGGRG